MAQKYENTHKLDNIKIFWKYDNTYFLPFTIL